MMDWERDAWCGGDHIPTRDRERARIVAMLRERAEELRYYRTPDGEAVPWAMARIEELVAMADRIEGGEDG